MADRLEKLKELEIVLHASLGECDSKSLAAIARQYRETIKEIEEIEGADVINDGIGDILSARKANGEPTTDRAYRAAV